MNPNRSRSRQRQNRMKQQKFESSRNNENIIQRDTSNLLRMNQRLQTSVPNQLLKNLKQSDTVRNHSPSPNRLQKQAQLINQRGGNVSQAKRDKSPFRQTKKIDNIKDLAIFLRNSNKPFTPTDINYIQPIFQKFTNIYSFESIFEVYLYLFLHSTLQQSLYKIFYALILKTNKDSPNQKQQSQKIKISSRFYETVIKTVLKTIYEEFKNKIERLQNLQIQTYWQIAPEQRQKIMNRSLYPGSPTIRNGLTLIRKAMQKQRSPVSTTNISIHPIRQILKILKQMIKTFLKNTFVLPVTMPETQIYKFQSIFNMLLISELSLIIHFKYKHHVNAQFQQTLNEATILKMKKAQLQIELKENTHFSLQSDSKKSYEEQKIHNYQQFQQQHQKNYLYFLFVLNLSQYNKVSLTSGLFVQSDLTIFTFYMEPILDEYKKSTQFLQEKIQNNEESKDKKKFYSCIPTNFGVIQNKFQYIASIRKRSQMIGYYNFVVITYVNILQKLVVHINSLSKQKQVAEKKKILLYLVNALCPLVITYEKLHFPQFKETFNQSRNEMEVQDSIQTPFKQQFKYLIKQFSEIVFIGIKNLRKHIVYLSKNSNSISTTIFKSTTALVTSNEMIKIQESNPSINNNSYAMKVISNIQQLASSLVSEDNKAKDFQLTGDFTLLLFSIFKFKSYSNYLKQLMNLAPKTIIQSQSKQAFQSQFTKQTSQNIEKGKLKELLIKMNNTRLKINQYYLIQKGILTQTLQFQDLESKIKQRIFRKLHEKLFSDNETISKPKHLKINSQQLIAKINLQQFFIKSQQEQSQLLKKYQQKTCRKQKILEQSIIYKVMQEKNRTEIKLKQITNKTIEQIINFVNTVEKISKNQGEEKYRKHLKSYSLQNVIGLKEISLLKKQIMEVQLEELLASILILYKGSKNQKQRTFNLHIINMSIQEIFVEIFKIYKNNVQRQQQIAINMSRLQKQNQLTKKFGIASNQIEGKQKELHKNQVSPKQEIELLFSEVLAKIYFKFMKQFKFNSQLYAFVSLNSSIQQNTKQSNSQTLEQVLVIKLKKCISMFYDKINDSQIKEYLNCKNTFILRCLAITFYKIKTVCESLFIKFGVFDRVKMQEMNKSNQQQNQYKKQLKYIQSIFFYIQDPQLIEPYVKFVATRDKIYFKQKLIQAKEKIQNDENKKNLWENIIKVI